MGMAGERGEGVDGRSGCAIVTKDLVRVLAADIQLAIWSECQTIRRCKPTASRGHKGREKRSCGPGVLQDTVGIPAADIEIAVWSEGDARWSVQPAACGKDVHERAGRAVVAQNLARAITRSIEIAVRSIRQ